MSLHLHGTTKRIVLLIVACLGFVAVIAGTAGYPKEPREAQIVSHFPRDGAKSVSRTAHVVAWMDRPIDEVSGDLGLQLQDQQGNAIDGALEVGADRESIIFEPASALAPGSYLASLNATAAPSASGAELGTWTFSVPEKPSLDQGPGGSILLVVDESSEFSAHYAEILRMEGLNSFETTTVEDLTPQLLDAHELVILATGTVGAGTAKMFSDWVEHENGNLIAMEPTGQIAELAGVVNHGPDVSDGYIHIDTSQAPGKGIASDSLQFHGDSSRLELKSGTRAIASQGSTAWSTGGRPAVTVKPGIDGRGTVAAYSFNLAKSTVLTRQGNPEWAGQERDGIAPIRPDDLFFGGDESDYLDLEKVHIPQADEHLRLLANLIGYVNQGNGPMPKFWYLPNFSKAALVMAADDHGTVDGTRRMFERLSELSPKDCSVEQWECLRATSWLYPESGLTPANAESYSDSGFDVGAHVTTGCEDWDAKSLTLAFSQSLGEFRKKYPGLPAQTGNRLHCIAWSQWSTQASTERSWGMRIDMNYYYWPGDWIRQRAGFMTGSGFPMRFSDPEGNLINVYQQETHLVDEVFADHPEAVEQLLERATGPEGFYGAFGTHVDFSTGFDIDLMDMAIRHSIPMISAKQLLEWTDARNASSFKTLNWEDGELSFELDITGKTHGMLKTMLPIESNQGTLTGIRSEGLAIDLDRETIKGVDYVIFTGASGTYTATYR
ncbi:hypothetical protein GCM10009715_39620 [Paeniglutamicibacter psychrophenolicus]|uniref:SbsA Ig-like domain-containing protein n=1 Tax=Paeniglutamicibacter psychrophenolicus TaxID=257454 RepID=A0ABS4WJB2_9MICC|nr:Ig-like domain-containing protein [Paeniglutamicibacter psychrophenolicus]MBP2376058.1 hypothetical protein [Paeniglutamicibacter psychrophenolicus]